jgi:hypothetical protein
MPSERTSSTSPAPHSRPCRARHGAVGPGNPSVPTCSGCWTRSPALPRSSATTAWTSWPPTPWDGRCTPRCSPGELSTRSDEFRVRWATHDVRFYDAVLKRLRHPVVGELDLHYNRIVLPGDDGLSLTTYTAEPGSRSEEALKLFGSWAATVDAAETADTSGSAQAS